MKFTVRVFWNPTTSLPMEKSYDNLDEAILHAQMLSFAPYAITVEVFDQNALRWALFAGRNL